MTLKNNQTLFPLVSVLVLGAAIAAVQAQDSAADEPDDDIEEVIVTGSHIKGIPGDAISPVDTLTREDLVNSGVSNFAEAVRDMNVANGSDVAVVNTTRTNPLSGTGLANVALRGLGPTATLVLMNNKRLPFAAQKLSDGDRFVDINSIPINMIDRVEVLKDGGSAIYGSDAIAGIVNFILRDDFEGFEFTAKSQNTTSGGDQADTTISALWGTAFNNGRTHLVVGGELFDRTGQRASERADLYLDRAPRQDAGGPVIAPLFNWQTTDPPGDPRCEDLGYFLNNIGGTASDNCYRRDAETTFSVPPLARTNLMVHFKHDFGPAEIDVSYSTLTSVGGTEQPQYPTPIAIGSVQAATLGSSSGELATGGLAGFLAGVNARNAVNPSTMANGGPLDPNNAQSSDLLDFQIRLPGVDAPRVFDFTGEQTQNRLEVRARGEFGSSQVWNWDVSLMQGEATYANSYLGMDKNRMELALFGLGGPNCEPDGAVQADMTLGTEAQRTQAFNLAGYQAGNLGNILMGLGIRAANPAAAAAIEGAIGRVQMAQATQTAPAAQDLALLADPASAPLVPALTAAFTFDFLRDGLSDELIRNGAVQVARFGLVGADDRLDLTATTPGAIGALEGIASQLVNNIEGYPLVNLDTFMLALTSSNHGQGGCQFLNPYLTRHPNYDGTQIPNSDELLRWIEVPIENAHESTSTLTVLDATATTTFGDIAVAFGLQSRMEGRDTAIHPQITGSVNSFGQQAGNEAVTGLSENAVFDANRSITALFAEAQVPLRDDLRMQAALRYEDYGGEIGNSIDPKVSFRWQFRDNMILRTSLGTSFRGPSLAQVEEGTGYSLEFNIRDHLAQVSEGAVAAATGRNCVRTNQCDLFSPEETNTNGQASITAVKRGLPAQDLQPETATTFNLGWVMTPQDGLGLGLGVDYYMIDFSDKIIDVPTQAFLDEEVRLFNAALAADDFVIVDATNADFDIGDTVCDPTEARFTTEGGPEFEDCQVDPKAYAHPAITRRPDLSRGLQIISGPPINTGRVLTTGIDFNVSYGFRFANAGNLNLAANITNILSYEVSDFPVGLPDYSAAGFTNSSPERRLTRSLPDLKANFNANYQRGSSSYLATLRYIGGYTDDDPRALSRELDAYSAIDFRYNYILPLGDNRLDLAAGIIDLTDAETPARRSQWGTDIHTFDTRGQRIYFQATWRM